MKIKEIEPIQERPAIHRYHFADNDFKDSLSKMVVIGGEMNRFPTIIRSGEVSIIRPYEFQIKEDLPTLIRKVKEEYVLVNLYGFPLSTINEYFNITSRNPSYNTNWYQKPLPIERYRKKLKKFRNKDLEFKVLRKEDIPKLKRLIRTWSKSKKDSAFSRFSLGGINSPQDIEKAISKLQSLQTEVSWMDFKEQEDSYYYEEMQKPAIIYYGAFKKDQLLAYTEIKGNSNFASFETRGSIRQNSYSPQEFLDYNIMERLVKDGVKLIHRGSLHTRKGASGLLKYKQKFGQLIAHREVDFRDVTMIQDESLVIARDLQGDPYL
ncbi:MAG: hypothetical protein ABIB79_00665 [archaeon]